MGLPESFRDAWIRALEENRDGFVTPYEPMRLTEPKLSVLDASGEQIHSAVEELITVTGKA